MKNKTSLKLSLLFSLFSNFAFSAGGMDTYKMIGSNLSGLNDCVHYCVVGFQTRMEIVPPFRYRVFTTPIVRHNINDYMVMAHRTSEDSAWLDYRNIFGKPFKIMGDTILSAATGGSILEIGGGQSQHEGFGKTQSLVFKDVDVVGNPSAYFIEALDARVNGTPRPYYTDSYGRKKYYDLQSKNYADYQINNALNDVYSKMKDNINFDLPDEVYQAVGGPFYRALVQTHYETLLFAVKAKAYAKALSAGGRTDFYACDSGTAPFKPYFNSRLDSLMWREGYPINDAHKSAQILNPLSSDGIKPSSEAGLSLNDMYSNWGHLYPRSGFLNQPEDYKTAAVIGYRGLDIATQGGGGHISQRSGHPTNSIIWQQVYPNPSKSCRVSVADTINQSNEEGNYAWSGWRRYQCPLSNRGWVIAEFFYDSPFCIGNEPN